ncbi:adenosine kinase [Amylibacter ulvae]|uniref:Adenosine kinase n=1 Tax=Paramylibacter ulvae TaxID=1651968 RepID=A0ABQ3D438_9RHOB|nr:adenosine kinase [Amylibacter ulvae]GHA57633.1 adenosine kinase [Amylibacter ulvae]
MSKKFQVVGIGNAIVDVLAHCEDNFLVDNGIEKGIMQLINTDRAAELYSHMGPATEISGGSGANTIAGLAALDVRTAYVGKVKDDQLGAIFAHDIRAMGAVYETPLAPKSDDAETGRCMVLVTPDGERSLNTYLGVSEHLSPDDIDVDQMADCEWLYLEGYRFDGPESHAAFAKAIEACKSTGGKVAVSLSDPFCVERHRDAFKQLIADHVDLLFCNEHEMMAMYGDTSLDDALALAGQHTEMVACTIGKNGALIIKDGKTHHADAAPVARVDATGAGDLFASGFMYGLVNGHDMLTCGQMGCVVAGEVIGHIGARPEADIKQLLAENFTL